MVRYVDPPAGVTYSENSRFKSSICQPKDNIGISCVFSTGNAATKDKLSTGVRRKYAVPKDNLGIACLPTPESVRLRDIPEVSEYDSSEETHVKVNGNTSSSAKHKLRSATTKITGRARGTAPKDNLSSSCRHVNRGVAIAQVRLRAGEDGDQTLDIGISNIRRPKHDPTKPRKPIVPKDNIGFSGRHLQKSLIRSSGLKTSGICSLKTSSESEKKASSTKSLSKTSEKRITTQNKSLKANRHKPK